MIFPSGWGCEAWSNRSQELSTQGQAKRRPIQGEEHKIGTWTPVLALEIPSCVIWVSDGASLSFNFLISFESIRVKGGTLTVAQGMMKDGDTGRWGLGVLR